MRDPPRPRVQTPSPGRRPTLNGRPLTEEDQRKLKARLDQIPTLAEAAIARLDDWLNLAIGKPAPEIDGVDVEGRPLKLSDYRGKVVLLLYWGSWCGPCMQQVPQERELTARYKGRPFTVLGVNCKEPAENARATMEKEGMTWPSWHDGEEHGGPSSVFITTWAILKSSSSTPVARSGARGPWLAA